MNHPAGIIWRPWLFYLLSNISFLWCLLFYIYLWDCDSIVDLFCIYLLAHKIEHYFLCYCHLVYSNMSLAFKKNRPFVLFLPFCNSALNILYIRPMLDRCIADIFFHSVSYLFTFKVYCAHVCVFYRQFSRTVLDSFYFIIFLCFFNV